MKAGEKPKGKCPNYGKDHAWNLECEKHRSLLTNHEHQTAQDIQQTRTFVQKIHTWNTQTRPDLEGNRTLASTLDDSHPSLYEATENFAS